MSARHPNRRRLQRWLDTGETRRVANHIEHCTRCQETLEDASALDEELVAGLQAATSPPTDLRERTHGGVDARLRDEAVLGAFFDLFAIGWDVARSLVDPDAAVGDGPHNDDRPADETDGGT
jgi:hypothetical protein